MAQEPAPPVSRKVKRTNVDKVLFPATGLTKGDLISYYDRVGEVILPHLSGRLVSVKRYPNGVEGKKWWERDHRINDLPTLLEFANKAAIELHPVLAFADARTADLPRVRPRPGAAGRHRAVLQGRARLRGMFSELGLELREDVRRQGDAGLRAAQQRTSPTRDPAVRQGGCRDDGERHAGRGRLTDDEEVREGKVLVDWGQNDHSKSTVCAYSLRGKAADGVDAGRLGRAGRPGRSRFEWNDALERIERDGDIFAPVLTLKLGAARYGVVVVPVVPVVPVVSVVPVVPVVPVPPSTSTLPRSSPQPPTAAPMRPRGPSS